MTQVPPAGTRSSARRFLCGEDGAVTIDFFGLLAMIVFLGMGAGMFASSEVPELAAKIDSALENTEVRPQ